MKTKQGAFFLLLILCGFGLKAQVAEYYFCVNSEEYESFKAHVVFKGLDFGQGSAEQMVRNDLESMLGESMEIKVFSPSTCPCENDCQQVEISAKDWNGNLDERGLSFKSIWGSTVEIGDAVISEGRALWNNPGEFLMTRVFGQSTKK